MEYRLREITARTILSPSGLPDADWVVNPYTGCAFGCSYCYAAFVGRFSHPGEPWGSYVDVKTNAPELLRKELAVKLKGARKKDIGTVFFSSVTDPYQGAEATYRLTRQCLQVLADTGYTGPIGILTKSTLATRDIGIFKQLKHISVGLTVTSTGDPVARYLETGAPGNEQRLKTLKLLHAAGIPTYAFIGPLLPHFVGDRDQIRQLLSAVKTAGVSYIYFEHLNLGAAQRNQLVRMLMAKYPDLLPVYQKAADRQYRDRLDDMLFTEAKKIGLPIRHERPIYHKDKGSWQDLKDTNE